MAFVLSLALVCAVLHSADIVWRRRHGKRVTAQDVFIAAFIVTIAFAVVLFPVRANGADSNAMLSVEANTCRIVTDRLTSQRDTQKEGYGSGVLLYGKTPAGLRYILTAYHVISDYRSTVEVTWDGVTWYKAKPACVRPDDDAAILTVSEWPDTVCGLPTTGVRLADNEVESGERVYVFGFDGRTSVLRSVQGECMTHDTNENETARWFSVRCLSSEGMSGGPMVVLRDSQPLLIGNLWGVADDGSVRSSGCRLAVVRDMWGIKSGEPTHKSGGSETKLTAIDGLAAALGDDYVIKDTTGKVQPQHLYNDAGESLHHLDNPDNTNRLDLRPGHLPAYLPKGGVPSAGDPRFGPQWGIAKPNTGTQNLQRSSPGG